MPLKVVSRKDRGAALTIIGTVAGRRVRARAQSDDRKIAEEEAAAIEAQILRTAWHGERRGDRSLAQAVTSYVEAVEPSDATKTLLNRILRAVGNPKLDEVDQSTITKARHAMLRRDAKPATVLRNLIVPLKAVMVHARRRGWCDMPILDAPRQAAAGRTNYLLPEEAERLIDAAPAHLKPLLIFLLSTGARMSEALELEWRDVDLQGRRAILWRTKGRKRRDADLPPRAVIALAQLPHRKGEVFLTHYRQPYRSTDRQGGGQIKTAWKASLRRAGLDPELTPHDLRHTWASWHYAAHRDLLALKADGGWSSVTLVERYAHLLPAGNEDAIRRFRGENEIDAVRAL